jgi:DHA1 family bicyclomycin/chloramphenicol resistance-like MFS transporter
MLTLFAVVIAGIDSVFVLGGFMFVAFGFLGLVLPSTGVLAMEEQGEIAGSASAMMGTVQMIVASVVMGIVGAFADGTARPMVVAFAACAVLAFAITQFTLGGRSRQVSQVPAE